MHARTQETPLFNPVFQLAHDISRTLEAGDVPLEESLTRYERGNYLLQFCRQVLGKAEQQIEELTKAAESPTAPAALPASSDDEDEGV